jgi:mannosyltransferase
VAVAPAGRGAGAEGTVLSETAERGRANSGPTEPGPVAPQASTDARPWGRWVDWLVIAIPAATAFVVGGYELGGPSLWRDEAYTKDAITRSVSQIWAMLGNVDAVHGAYYLVMHFVAGAVGTSAVALRFPSLLAMVVATGFTAAIGRRAAALAQGPDAAGRNRAVVPALTGLLSGMVFATAPYMTYYAQMARPYAIVAMFATIASYLLLRAYPGGGWRWWTAYGAAVALAGLFHVFALLILAAHGLTLLLTDPAGTGRRVRRIGRLPVGWLVASAAAVIVLVPMMRVSFGQLGGASWLGRPDFETIVTLFRDFAGSPDLIVPVALLALGGITACCLADDWRPLNPAAIALPWLVVPPLVQLAVSLLYKPVYDERYVEFCLPALAILVAAGIVGLVRLAASTRLRQAGLAWLPPAAAALVVIGLAALLVGPQGAIRQTAYRPDNLRLASAIVAANEQPGDVVFYVPLNMRVLGTGYPAPFLKLRDIARAESGVASDTLTGTEINSPALLARRFTDVKRVWVVTGNNTYKFPVPYTKMDKEKLALLGGMHILHRWMAGEVMLTLYGY